MKSRPPAFLALDLGGSSGRAFLARFEDTAPMLTELRRFHYAPENRDGRLRWDMPHIMDEVCQAVRDAGRITRQTDASLTSVGVCSWGVDYGLVDADGQLLENPVCYRDARIEGVIEAVTRRVPREEIFARTGIQFLPFNTLFQLAAHCRDGLPAAAARLLLIPDLCHHALGGAISSEYTNASTTQMLSLATHDWDRDLLQRLSLPAVLLPPLVQPGTDLGPLGPTLSVDPGLAATRVVVPATHDTASAVAGTPLQPGWAYVSSGTWSLVGVEQTHALTSPAAARVNLTNEGGVFGTVRLLKNVMGLWIIEECRNEWAAAGREYSAAELAAAAAAIDAPIVLFDPDHARFLAPRSMLAALREALAETGHRVSDQPAALVKTVLDSLASRYAQIVDTIEELTGDAVAGIHIVGGGSLNDYLNQATADASGRPVRTGPVEATVLGNAIVQAIAAGRFRTLAEARRYVATSVSCRTFEPRAGSPWRRVSHRPAVVA
jgi:rhamnulokinase